MRLLLLVPVFQLAALSPGETQLLESIRAATLQAHISFLASDLLEGRDTPSRGISLAEEYIAAQFRRVGLTPAGDGGSFFQNAPYLRISQPMEGFSAKFTLPDGKSWESTGPKVMAVTSAAIQASGLDVVKVSISDENSPLPAKEAVAGKAVVLYMARLNAQTAARRTALLALEPAVVLTPGVLFNQRYRLRAASAPKSPVPMLITSDTDFSKLIGDLPDGPTPAKLSVNIPAPVEEPVQLRNVIARLPGSDPALEKQHIILSAHHDHTGLNSQGPDLINNGANDDASGVATVLALAEAFGTVPARPRRSILFMTYFGEEKGLLGSRYYASHPVVPLKDTVANLNFEHMGRTDDSEGSRVGKITASGFDYTTIGAALTEAGKDTGVEAWSHEKNSDAFFSRSDNQALADAGVPALTVCVAWIFPDYHRPGDHWDKIDYTNMQSVVRTAALTVEHLANAAEPPRWNAANPKTAKYVKAWELLRQ